MLLKYIKFHYMYILSFTRVWLVSSIVIILNMIVLSKFDIKNNQLFTFLAVIITIILSTNLNQANKGCKSYLLLSLLPVHTKYIVSGEYVCQIINYIVVNIAIIVIDKLFFNFFLFREYQIFMGTFIISFVYFSISNILQFSNISNVIKFGVNTILMGLVGGVSMSTYEIAKVLKKFNMSMGILAIVILYILSYFISLKLFKKSKFE